MSQFRFVGPRTLNAAVIGLLAAAATAVAVAACAAPPRDIGDIGETREISAAELWDMLPAPSANPDADPDASLHPTCRYRTIAGGLMQLEAYWPPAPHAADGRPVAAYDYVWLLPVSDSHYRNTGVRNLPAQSGHLGSTYLARLPTAGQMPPPAFAVRSSYGKERSPYRAGFCYLESTTGRMTGKERNVA